MQARIHTFTSAEPMLKVNAFIAETPKELVIIDTTLTMSDSKALRSMADELGKPIAGILLTHGHPDHIAGTYNIAPAGGIPIFALPSVKKLMEDTEAAKHAQWGPMFGNEWVPKWVYPNEMVNDGDTVKIAGLDFHVMDIGSGGDCDANSVWLLEDENKVAFIGDLLYKNNHTYMNDGSILRWMANLENLTPVLKSFDNYYVGHGAVCDFADMAKQKDYMHIYCAEVLKATKGSGIFTDETRKAFEQKMISLFPDYGCQFMVSLSADRVGRELLSLSHKN
ncbi:MAG TPA: MBL fold metallo-hydrolase [Chitinophaga sp.]|uniref:MBL fold metallo-hydrolase n=1 Tax=Chitinophaga sp. TaxID=1869181 RepID=UPI002D04B740|nr:MBL fold metallo-hydrolase [Chitinophaga sp.]HVI49259.1 MBL fold metallo-hydrolase [Chitinophaga sp.]